MKRVKSEDEEPVDSDSHLSDAAQSNHTQNQTSPHDQNTNYSNPQHNSQNNSNNNNKSNAEKPKAYTIKYKRPRGSRACTVCRARKVRCDAEIHIPCTNCITFGCECVLPETRKKGSGSEKLKRREDSHHHHHHHDHHHHHRNLSLTPHPVNRASSVASTAPSSGDLAVASAPMAPSVSSSGAAPAEPIHNISQVSIPPSLTSNYKVRPSMHKKDLLNNSNSRAALTFVGHSSIGVMVSKVGQNHTQLTDDLFEVSDNSSIDNVELEILKLRGAFLLPLTELARDLIVSYFEHVHPLMPIINRTEFMAKFDDPDDSPSLMLLQAVLLCGLRVSNNPLLFDSKGLSNLTSLTFFRRAKALYETNYESDPVSIVQTVILIGSYWEGPEDVTRNSFYWNRVGVGLAQGFGFHRDVSNSSSLTAAEKKIWRRIWWCLFEKDRNVAIAFGRPPSIDLTDCDVPMLTMDDFDENDPEEGVVSPYPVNETHALYFIHLVKLAEITGIIIKHQYTVKAELMKRLNKFSVIQHCDMLMGIWFTNLPPQLQLSLTDPSKQNFFACLLNAQYYNRLYLIHRANLLRMARSSSTNPNNYKYPSWGISFQAARMISIVSKILLNDGAIKFCPVMFVYIVFSALIMLIYHVDSSTSTISSAASDSLFICRAVLKELGKYWPIASVLTKLFEKYGNDRIKRAEVIDRNNVIVELQEREKNNQQQARAQRPLVAKQRMESGFGNPISPSDSATSGISPRDSSHEMYHGQAQSRPQQAHLPEQQRHAEALSQQGLQQGQPQPDIEQLVRQFKLKATEEEGVQLNEENKMEVDAQHQAANAQKLQLTGHSNTPSSVHSFPDISLVTEKVPPSQNFFENFEPTQLFPSTNVISYPPSRVQTPVLESKETDKAPEDHEEVSGATPGNGLYANNGAPTPGASGDLFTNFMDSSFINMNLQATAEESNYLTDDLNSLLQFKSV